MSSGNGDLIRSSGYLPATNRRTSRELRRISDGGLVEAHRLDLEAALYQRRQDHAELATMERIHAAGILMSAAEAVVARSPGSAPLVASALQDWDYTTGRNYRRTFA